MMENTNKNALYLIIGSSVLLFVLYWHLHGIKTIELNVIFDVISRIVTIEIFFIAIFVKYLWKFKVFQNWLVAFPDLSGRWDGLINSTWCDPSTGRRPDPIPVCLSIQQNFLNISCHLYTQEGLSRSFCSNFIIDHRNQIKQIVYLFQFTPKSTVAQRNPQKYGAAILNISEIDDLKKLSGNYPDFREINQAFR